MTPAEVALFIRTVVVIGQGAALRKAFIAGVDGQPTPTRTDQAANHAFGREVAEIVTSARPDLAQPEPLPAPEITHHGSGPVHHPEMIQGSEEWYAARCGMLTASEMKLILTPSLAIAKNDKQRAHLYELLAQRITGYVEPQYIGDDMLRGIEDELLARLLYAERYAPVTDVGFITNDRWGFTLGYSPDGLVGDDGQIECKSRRQKYQVQTIVENVPRDLIDADYMLQVQTGLLVSERAWCDLISYSGGLPMATVRVFPDPAVQQAIVNAAASFETALCEKLAVYRQALVSDARLLPTERKVEQQMYV